jgi:hypothetical protein
MINFHRENRKPNINRVCDWKVASMFCMADLGCTMGINTLLSADTIIRAVKIAFNRHSMDVPEFQVYFADLPSNDFNTLLWTLPPCLVDDMTEGDGKTAATLDEDNPPASRYYFVSDQGIKICSIFKVLGLRRKQFHCVCLIFLIPTVYLFSQMESVWRRYRDLTTKSNREKFGMLTVPVRTVCMATWRAIPS